MGRILRQIACAAGVMSLVPTSRHLPQQRRAPSRSALQMASQLETLEPQLKRVVITGMGIVQCMNQSSRRVRRCWILASTPSTRRQLDGVVSHRSILPATAACSPRKGFV